MHVYRFRCPHCTADLRIRDEDLVAAPVPCPECRRQMVLARDGAGGVTVLAPGQKVSAVRPAQPATGSAGQGRPATAKPRKPAGQPSRQPARRSRLSDLRLGGLSAAATRWVLGGSIVAAALAAVTLGIAFWPAAPAARNENRPLVAPDHQQANATAAKPVASKPVPKKVPAKPATVADRLAGLGQGLEKYRARRGHFPAAAVGKSPPAAAERLSWLAELAATSLFPERAAPQWNEPWQSPRNESFVRRRIPEFLNPGLEHPVNPQNYPATHFVGVAGVGADAADLPLADERAGIFGNDRTTRLDDIRDGASNTLMVLGVTKDIGSWAGGGRATVRPLTREPYVNGPDGFGTGAIDRMSVLLADGSVREISSTADPRIVRRMAAMADGLPLDPQIPGEPGDRSRRAPKLPPAVVQDTPQRVVMRSPAPAPRPAAAAAPASSRAVDVSAGLNQRIVRFEQRRAVPLHDVLTILEDLLAVPIHADKRELPDLDDLYQTPVSFDLKNTTVSEVLRAVLAQAKLDYTIEPDAIRLRKSAAGPANGSVH